MVKETDGADVTYGMVKTNLAVESVLQLGVYFTIARLCFCLLGKPRDWKRSIIMSRYCMYRNSLRPCSMSKFGALSPSVQKEKPALCTRVVNLLNWSAPEHSEEAESAVM